MRDDRRMAGKDCYTQRGVNYIYHVIADRPSLQEIIRAQLKKEKERDEAAKAQDIQTDLTIRRNLRKARFEQARRDCTPTADDFTSMENFKKYCIRCVSINDYGQYSQKYLHLSLGLLITFALSGVLVLLAYLLSMSAAQDVEKRSEYECGFAPFDNATRLPFDVHFYLVGIAFLVFDGEVALLYPHAVSASEVGSFGLLLLGIFVGLLAVGFFF